MTAHSHETWDQWDPGRDLSALERVAAGLYADLKPADARIVMRAWRALGGVATAPDDGATGAFST
jgi:hypothetical protein